MKSDANKPYVRYHIDTKAAPGVVKWPSRFQVKVGKLGLAKHLLREIWRYGPLNPQVILSRPCIYGVFSGPVGGFAPRPQHCVACLRCTTEYYGYVTVFPNPEHSKLGDSYFAASYVETLNYEAEEGKIPVKGAGYRGKFGGSGWDGMWTDMSEIVRPTRDGIHGREFISTVTDIGYKPNALSFDASGQPTGPTPRLVSIPLPILFDAASPAMAHPALQQSTAQAAAALGSLAIMPLAAVLDYNLHNEHVVPVITPGDEARLAALKSTQAYASMIEIDGWDAELYDRLRQEFPQSIISLRLPFESSEQLLAYVQKGIHVFHFLADFHGRGTGEQFVLELIRAAHARFVQAGIREEVTLLGSGGIIAAEHIPKAILCGLDAVALDTPLVVVLQGRMTGECADRASSTFKLPPKLTTRWVQQRLINLAAAWRDQLLEISGAMGLRETRRMRGEMGRAMLVSNLEAEAFTGVEGYEQP